MSLFDPSTFSMPKPRPVCPECGGGVGRGGAPSGDIVKAHNRWDQAMVVGIGNPCPGEGQLSMDPDLYVDANTRRAHVRRIENGGEHTVCKTTGRVAFVADLDDNGVAYRHCSECKEEWLPLEIPWG
jgi:hypothetical protein